MGSLRWPHRVAGLVVLAVGVGSSGFAAEDDPPTDPGGKKRPSLHDSLDGALDLSDVMIESNGFVPVPILITEPALGSFGGGLAPVFIKKNPPMVKDGEEVPVPPNVTAVAAAYTLNGTWFAGGGRMARIPQHGLRYTVGAGYGDVNLDFYETLPSGEDKAIGFEGQGAAFYGKLVKEIGGPRLSVGFQYTLGKIKMRLADPGELPPFVTDKSLDSVMSTLGPVVEWDARDNIFSPDSGVKLHAHFNWSDDWLGSDYRYGRLNSYVYGYVPLGKSWQNGRNWISAFRVDWQQATGDPPFYLLPYVDMRGIPAVRYQGRITTILESEQRIDFTRRWSGVFFGGLAKAFDDYADAGNADLVYGYGAGFRYLIARKFKLRMGVDVAHGPEKWAYYIVFGSAWKR